MSANSSAIETIKNRAPSDAEALAQIFTAATISDNGTPGGRLTAILAATESNVVPGLQTGIRFHDRGFRVDFRDPWPSSDNQVGHFLTAVGLSFNPAKVEQAFFARRLRDWLGAPPTMGNEEVALRLTIGHEKAADPGLGTVAEGATGLGMLGGLVGMAAGAGMEVLNVFRTQFAACTSADILVFRDAERALGTGRPLNMAAAKPRLRGIRVTSSQRGNSYEDLLLSLYGWRLGQDIKLRRIASKADITAWLRGNLM